MKKATSALKHKVGMEDMTTNWNERVLMIADLTPIEGCQNDIPTVGLSLPLKAPEVIVMKTSVATSDKEIVILTNIGF